MGDTFYSTHAPWHYVSSCELAGYLSVSPRTLATWRFRRCGPNPERARKFKRRSAYYKVAEVLAWQRSRGGESILPWQVIAEWLQSRYIFPHPLQTEEQTQRVVEQLERWNIFPQKHKPRRRIAVAA